MSDDKVNPYSAPDSDLGVDLWYLPDILADQPRQNNQHVSRQQDSLLCVDDFYD